MLIFSDARCFGRLELCSDFRKHRAIKALGPDGLDAVRNRNRFMFYCERRKRPIKQMLLDQSVIAGIGNIYASEILFQAGISPFSPSCELSLKQHEKLAQAMVDILSLAIEKNGTSISDYKRVDDKTGEFQDFLKVYGKEKESCQRCGNPIQRRVQNQRSSFFCANCQC